MSSAVRWRFPHSRGASWALAGLVVASGFWGLARVNQGNLPELLQVQEVSPLEVEVGGHIEVSGRGFPQGRVAEVTFRGTLHRPGKDPVQRAEIRTEGTVLGPNHIEVPYSPELESQFCGAGEEQVHTTFDGAVLVSFPSAVAGAPPVVGTLSHATLDLRPLVRHKSVQDARKSAGARTVKDLGLELAEDEPTPLGLRIETVMPHSRADDIGLSAGDSLEKVDGVRVHGVEDVLPRGNKAFAELALRRQGDGAPFVKHVRLGGMASQSPSDLVLPSAVLLLLFASVLFAFAPPVGPLAWVERRMAASLASLSRGRPSRRNGGTASVGFAVGSARSLLPSAWRIGKASLPWLVVPPAVFLGFDLDIGIVYLVLALLSVLLAGAAAVGGSRGPNGRPSFAERCRDMARRAGNALVVEVGGAAAVGAVVLMTGTFRLAEVVSVQGGVPWKWYAFANPVTLALFVAYLAAFVGKPLLAQEGATGFWSFWGSLRGHLMSGLGVLLYLGAWQVPGMGPGEAHRSALLCAVGSLVLVAKVALLRGFAEVLSHGMRREEFAPLLAQAFRFRVGLSLVALGLLLVVGAWVEWGPGPEVARLFGLGTFGLVLAAVVHIVSRIRFHLRETSTRLAVNPFL